MFIHKKQTLYFFIPLFVSFICLLLFYATEKNNIVYLNSDTGTWDLSKDSFSMSSFNLNGSIEYIPNELLTPEEFNIKKDKAIIEDLTKLITCSTRRIRILLPDNNYYAFSHINNNFATRIYVNGEWVKDIGQVGKNINECSPDTENIMFTAKPQNGVIEIVQQSSNFIKGIHKEDPSWYVSSLSNINKLPTNGYKDSIKMGGFLISFLIHITLFIFFPKVKANLYFSLFHLNYIISIGFTGQKIFREVLFNIPWIIQFRIEHVTIPIRAVLIMLIVNTLFPYVLSKYEKYLFYGISFVFISILLFVNITIIKSIFFICQITYTILVLYTIPCFIIRRPKNIHPEDYIFLAGYVQLLFCMIFDYIMLKSKSGGDFGETTSVGTLLLALCGVVAVLITTINQVEESNVKKRHLMNENENLDKINRLRGKMISTITHEMRTPLTIMSVYSQCILEDLREKNIDKQTAEDLKTISDEAKRLANMASEMLEFTKEENYKKSYEEIDINITIKQIAGLCSQSIKKNKNTLEISLPDDMPKIYGNSNEFSQIIWNVLDNAIRHTENGQIHVKGSFDNERVNISIIDNGEGIPKEILPYVFQRNVKGGDKGRSGLGLNICREIIEAHGGKIDIKSTLNQGTEVYLSFPRYKN